MVYNFSWQITAKCRVKGNDGPVDVDLYKLDYEGFQWYKGMIINGIFTKLRENETILSSESGRFLCIDGIVQRFAPASHNVIKDGVDLPHANMANGLKHYKPAVKTMIVPSGVRDFCDGFFQNGAVTDVFVLPETLTSIGRDGDTFSIGCFSGCYLPEVVLPENVRFIGRYSFSRSYIEKLVVRASNEAPYLRQFKDSTIKKLYLPYSVTHPMIGEERDFYRNFNNHCNCKIIYY